MQVVKHQVILSATTMNNDTLLFFVELHGSLSPYNVVDNMINSYACTFKPMYKLEKFSFVKCKSEWIWFIILIQKKKTFKKARQYCMSYHHDMQCSAKLVHKANAKPNWQSNLNPELFSSFISDYFLLIIVCTRCED